MSLPGYSLDTTSSGSLLPNLYPVTAALQTTLDPHELLGLFAREAQQVVGECRYRLTDPVRELDIKTGPAGKHSCAYRLHLLGEDLGEITLSRNRRFMEEELIAFEMLLSALLYPLRNVLYYHDALRAAYRDPLTGVGNRAAFNAAVGRELDLARRSRTNMALMVMDLDHFKRINDGFGHQVGDQILHAAARRISTAVRSCDLVYRYGGEEFVALLVNSDMEGASKVAERVRQSMAAHPITCGEHTLQVTVSIGMALLDESDDGHRLFARADRALYGAKQSGRNCVMTA